MQTKLQIAMGLSSWLQFVPMDSRSSTRSEGEKAKACEEETQSTSMPRETHIRQKEKVGMPAVRKCAAAERACARQREKVDEGPASGKCEDEHPVVTMVFWPINDA